MKSNKQLFELGNVYATPNVLNAHDANTLADCLELHARGEWGDVAWCDKCANNDAVANGGRILSRYNLLDGNIYIITERDRSVTTIMLVNEY